MAGFTFTPLTPSAYLDRAAWVFRDRIAIVDGERHFTYAEFGDRAHRLAGALHGLGVQPGDRVAALCVNSHVMLELHNGVPLAGAVLVPLNIRLSRDELVYILRHSGARIMVVTAELAGLAAEIAAATGARLLVAGAGEADEYEGLLRSAAPAVTPCEDERGLLAISYTSGTTGRPKGVMYHHRGAYLQALAAAFHARLTAGSVYLWTLPMFHCDGWCFTWAATAAGATHLCLRAIDPARIWELLRTGGVTHFSAAPTVLTMIANAPEAGAGAPLEPPVQVQTGGAPPSPTLIARMAALGLQVTHLYGLTETYGPLAINDWNPAWDARSPADQAVLQARQGVGNVIADRLRVVDADGNDVPADGETIGELVCRGNDVMLGYYRDEEATAEADLAGWFHTGDLAVMYPDGYAEIRDRAKDIIISGGENIPSVEVERVLDSHPAVIESAVVGRPDDVWGEVAVAFVTLRPGVRATPDELIEHVRARLARFKAPKEIVMVTDLPKTSTGKIQKHVLREQVRAARSR
ncbi:MAG TPA: long-chain-fatty-acid--CoA ligase [Streptosporangiaceae bacterium]|nr:long-chain-fatty-acid--CoA ligase [Streptosporangiaceae bacterium]